MKRMNDFFRREWFLLVMLLTISLIVLLFQML
jgi:hypothetical protein